MVVGILFTVLWRLVKQVFKDIKSEIKLRLVFSFYKFTSAEMVTRPVLLAFALIVSSQTGSVAALLRKT